MVFQELKNYIYCPLELVIGDEHIKNVDVHSETASNYDSYEVIGIRSDYSMTPLTDFLSASYPETRVIISLKKHAPQTPNKVTD